jgi:hypothetical protein
MATTKKRAIQTTGAFLLMIGYLWLLLGVPMHLIVHQKVAEEVCLEPENPCHLTLVHADLEYGCEHDSHFKQEVRSCEICVMLQTVSVQYLTKDKQVVPPFKISHETKTLSTTLAFIYHCLPEYRGPPLIS